MKNSWTGKSYVIALIASAGVIALGGLAAFAPPSHPGRSIRHRAAHRMETLGRRHGREPFSPIDQITSENVSG